MSEIVRCKHGCGRGVGMPYAEGVVRNGEYDCGICPTGEPGREYDLTKRDDTISAMERWQAGDTVHVKAPVVPQHVHFDGEHLSIYVYCRMA